MTEIEHLHKLYLSKDGKYFESASECLEHEESILDTVYIVLDKHTVIGVFSCPIHATKALNATKANTGVNPDYVKLVDINIEYPEEVS